MLKIEYLGVIIPVNIKRCLLLLHLFPLLHLLLLCTVLAEHRAAKIAARGQRVLAGNPDARRALFDN